MTAGAKEVVKTIFSGIDDSLYDEESAINLIEQYARDYALQIAEKAVEKEEQHWEGDTTIRYAFDNLLSRIKSELNSSGVNEDINTTETGGVE